MQKLKSDISKRDKDSRKLDEEEKISNNKQGPHIIDTKKGNINKEFRDKVKQYQKIFKNLKTEVGKVVVGQQEILESFLEALVSHGNCLVEGIPGIAKTLLVRSLAQVTGCKFSRIQFTPDLLPSDIIGITTYDESRGFYTIKGPIFSNFVLGDEINRAPPKVQSALLEGMQERQVTIGKSSYPLPAPFFVMATQNPVEQMGTYPLPEAQIDRFLYKLIMGYPKVEEEKEILHKNISLNKFEDFKLKSLLTPEKILEVQKDVKKIYLDKKIEKYIVKLSDATRFPDKYKIRLGKYVEYGASPRSSIGLFIASKSHALITGRVFVTPHDIKYVAPKVLRHRIILNYEGQAEEIDSGDIIKEILDKVPIV
ncbi:AAA domain-containing protein [Candidatus Woesearchaeota archaeon]|nr:AAA domain-containing protein [Candidatus Woesearchaeota archaeon]